MLDRTRFGGQRLLADAPGPAGDDRWDVLLAGLAEHLAMRDGKDTPGWSASRALRRFWFPICPNALPICGDRKRAHNRVIILAGARPALRSQPRWPA